MIDVWTCFVERMNDLLRERLNLAGLFIYLSADSLTLCDITLNQDFETNPSRRCLRLTKARPCNLRHGRRFNEIGSVVVECAKRDSLSDPSCGMRLSS